MNTIHRWLGVCITLMMVLTLASRPITTRAAEALDTQCFDVPGITNCLAGTFLDYWRTNGGLPVFGYPITAAADEVNRDTGQTYLTQWLERNRFEVHPENAGTAYEVLLGLLGKDRLAQQGRDWQAEGREPAAIQGCLWFQDTGHNVCDQAAGVGFKTYWQHHGLKIAGLDSYARSLQLFGMPLTAPKMETNSSGDTVMTQWFERARFEWHPNNPDEFKVLLGLLGTEVRAGGSPAPQPQPTPQPTPPPASNPCADVPQPVSARVRPSNCEKLGTIFRLDFYGFNPNEEVGYWITSPEGVIVGTVETVNIGPSGGVDNLTFDTDGLWPGLWQITFQGVDSGHTAVVYLKLLD